MQIQWSPFGRVCFSMCVGTMGTALASPLYPLYKEAWHLQPSDITVIYTIYMVGAMVSLLFLARLTDRFGYLPVLRAGMVLVTLGVALSMVAWNPGVFMASRLAIGLASGMITTASAIGLSQLNDDGDPRRAAAFTTVALTLGFGLGPLVGGLIAQWVPMPLASAYFPSLVMGGIAIYALFRMRATPPLSASPGARAARSWLARCMPRLTLPPAAQRSAFWIAAMGAFSTFGIFSLYASLAPSFMKQLLPWHGPAASGLSIAMILFLSSVFQLAGRRMPLKACAVTGMGVLSLSNLLLMLTARTGSAGLFVVCVFTTAFGHGMANLAGMALVDGIATPDNRAGLLSSYLIVGYIGSILPILGTGWLSDHLGLTAALLVFCAAMALLTAGLAWAIHARLVIPGPHPAARS
ncbi:MAG: MFS transporter [Noviherbaspirillum sp.]